MKFAIALIAYILISFNNVHLLSQSAENWQKSSDPNTYQKLYIHTDREIYFQGDSIWYKAYYLNGHSQQFVAGAFTMYMDLIDSDGEVKASQTVLLNHGQADGKITIPKHLETGQYLIRSFTDSQRELGEDAFFKKFIEITNVSGFQGNTQEILSDSSVSLTKIHVDFLPEGGYLLADQMNTIGVKAIGEDGMGISLQGNILDEKGEVVSQFSTDYKGMDQCGFKPQFGETYSVSIQNYPQFTHTFTDIVKEGIKIEYSQVSGENLIFKVSTNSDLFCDKVYHFAIVHRGRVFFSQKFVQKGAEFPIKVNRAVLPAGISRFIICNDQLTPLSERLYFSSNTELNNLKVNSDEKAYGPRSKVQLEILDEDEISEMSFSNLSISVVDANAIGENGIEQNILSWMLIDSELKGNIESPTDFFKDDDQLSSQEKLDLLMLTNGWSRYLWPLFTERYIDRDRVSSDAISLTGTVKKLYGNKPIEKGEVDLKIYQMDNFFSAKGKIDKLGRFRFDSIIFEDTAMVFIQARNKKGKLNTIIELDSIFEERPGISRHYLPSGKSHSEYPSILYENRYYNELDSRYYILDSGSIMLEEVAVIEKKKSTLGEHFRIYGESFDSKSIKITRKDLGYRNILEYLDGRVAGVVIKGDVIIIRGVASYYGSSQSLFLLDGVSVSFETLKSIPLATIDIVEVLLNPGSTAIYGTRGGNGVISVYTKKGNVYEEENSQLGGTISAKICGYSSHREFYSPTYTPENINTDRPDHRLTLYWNPSINTENGKASLRFFTSDDISDYKIFVEGITQTGEICLGTSEFSVLKEGIVLPD